MNLIEVETSDFVKMSEDGMWLRLLGKNVITLTPWLGKVPQKRIELCPEVTNLLVSDPLIDLSLSSSRRFLCLVLTEYVYVIDLEDCSVLLKTNNKEHIKTFWFHESVVLVSRTRVEIYNRSSKSSNFRAFLSKEEKWKSSQILSVHTELFSQENIFFLFTSRSLVLYQFRPKKHGATSIRYFEVYRKKISFDFKLLTKTYEGSGLEQALESRVLFFETLGERITCAVLFPDNFVLYYLHGTSLRKIGDRVPLPISLASSGVEFFFWKNTLAFVSTEDVRMCLLYELDSFYANKFSPYLYVSGPESEEGAVPISKFVRPNLVVAPGVSYVLSVRLEDVLLSDAPFTGCAHFNALEEFDDIAAVAEERKFSMCLKSGDKNLLFKYLSLLLLHESAGERHLKAASMFFWWINSFLIHIPEKDFLRMKMLRLENRFILPKIPMPSKVPRQSNKLVRHASTYFNSGQSSVPFKALEDIANVISTTTTDTSEDVQGELEETEVRMQAWETVNSQHQAYSSNWVGAIEQEEMCEFLFAPVLRAVQSGSPEQGEFLFYVLLDYVSSVHIHGVDISSCIINLLVDLVELCKDEGLRNLFSELVISGNLGLTQKLPGISSEWDLFVTPQDLDVALERGMLPLFLEKCGGSLDIKDADKIVAHLSSDTCGYSEIEKAMLLSRVNALIGGDSQSTEVEGE